MHRNNKVNFQRAATTSRSIGSLRISSETGYSVRRLDFPGNGYVTRTIFLRILALSISARSTAAINYNRNPTRRYNASESLRTGTVKFKGEVLSSFRPFRLVSLDERREREKSEKQDSLARAFNRANGFQQPQPRFLRR